MYVPLKEVFSIYVYNFVFEPFHGLKFFIHIKHLSLTVTKIF